MVEFRSLNQRGQVVREVSFQAISNLECRMRQFEERSASGGQHLGNMRYALAR